MFALCAAVSSAQAPDPITSSFDGSENPVSGNPNIDTVFARTKTGTVEYMKAGKVVSTTTSVMSDDGKTLTVTVKFLDAQGKAAQQSGTSGL